MGLLINESNIQASKPQIMFFFTGDFMHEKIKKNQIRNKWALGTINIDMQRLFMIKT
jgi:hypothetical protein